MASTVICRLVTKPHMLALIKCIKGAFESVALYFSGTCIFLITQLCLACTNEISLYLQWSGSLKYGRAIVRSQKMWGASFLLWVASFLSILLSFFPIGLGQGSSSCGSFLISFLQIFFLASCAVLSFLAVICFFSLLLFLSFLAFLYTVLSGLIPCLENLKK